MMSLLEFCMVCSNNIKKGIKAICCPCIERELTIRELITSPCVTSQRNWIRAVLDNNLNMLHDC